MCLTPPTAVWGKKKRIFKLSNSPEPLRLLHPHLCISLLLQAVFLQCVSRSGIGLGQPGNNAADDEAASDRSCLWRPAQCTSQA